MLIARYKLNSAVVILSLIVNASALRAGTTTVLFQPTSPTIGPFPTDALTVSDTAQKTGVRVNLPSACGTPAVSACVNTKLLNQLDGFSVNPRVSVCFSDAINPGTLNDAIQFIAADGSGTTVKANQAIYDPTAKCAYAKPDRVLAEDTRYLMLVSEPLNDTAGQKVQAAQGFADCLNGKTPGNYCAALSGALGQTGRNVSGSGKLLSASLFTTMSATDWLQKARRVADASPAVVLPAGSVSSFDLADITSLTYMPQDDTGTNPAMAIPISALEGVGNIVFGLYLSPNFLDPSGIIPGSIAASPTNQPIVGPVALPGLDPPLPAGYVPVSFHVFLPSGKNPQAGWPVAIYGHGLGDNQFGAPTYIASTLAQKGIATIAIEIPGHGFGPLSHVEVVDTAKARYIVQTPGRGLPLSAGGTYGPTDGCILSGPLAVRDCGRQTAVDLFALVHTIQMTQGLGLDLDPAQISYVGQSFGGTYGTMFHAVEPAVGRAVLNVAGGTSSDVSRLAVTARPLAAYYLGTNNPPLLNVPPPNNAPSEAYFHDMFNDNYVLRDMPVVVNDIPGAMPIQAAFEVVDWLGMLGDPLAFAPHLKSFPLPGVSPKSTLFQFGFGDLEVPNPTESAVVRAADGLNTTWFFRFDLAANSHPELLTVAFPDNPKLPVLPHRYLSNPTIFSVPAEQSIALAAQMQVAAFFKGQGIRNPNPFLSAPFSPSSKLFEIPAALPEKLNFLQINLKARNRYSNGNAAGQRCRFYRCRTYLLSVLMCARRSRAGSDRSTSSSASPARRSAKGGCAGCRNPHDPAAGPD